MTRQTNVLPSFSPFFFRLQASVEVREAGKRAVTTIPHLRHLNPGTLIKQGMHANERTAAGDNMNSTTSNDIHSKLTILHYNDVYNIDATCKQEPIGGAARFCTAVKTFAHLNPLVLFSGDAFSPSMRKYSTPKSFNR